MILGLVKTLVVISEALSLVNMLCIVLSDETSGSEEEMLHYYSPASELGHRSRKKKKPKTQSKSSQSLFSVIVSINHGLVAVQTHATVNTHPFLFNITYSLYKKRIMD